jgi:uncharacterized lipoprotein YmbA
MYTLEPSADGPGPARSVGRAKVVEVRRVVVPDAYDNQDILVREGSTLIRSSNGRWASRFSLSATHFLSRQLAQRRPDILFTDQPQVEAPDYRLFVTVNALDVVANGAATLEADWLIVPRDPRRPSLRQRATLRTTGSTATDQDVVSLNMALLRQLADALAASGPW